MILALRILYFEDLSVGMTETLSKTIAASDVVGFAQLTGDRNPIHLSEHFAAKTQFGKRIAHGLYTASLISAVLGTRLPGPGAVYISQTLNFRAPVKIGDQVDVTVTVAQLIPDRQPTRPTSSCMVADEIVLGGQAWAKVPAAAKSKRPLPRLWVGRATGQFPSSLVPSSLAPSPQEIEYQKNEPAEGEQGRQAHEDAQQDDGHGNARNDFERGRHA